METIADKLKGKFSLWIGYKEEKDGDYKYLAIAKKKVKGGIKHLVYWYKALDIKKIKADIGKYGNFSERPYRLAQACDGSIDEPVFALYLDFCRAKRIDAKKLYKKAYPESKQQDYGETLKHAKWEGVEYPEKWDKTAYEGLIESLTEINNHSLVGELCELENTFGF